MTQVQASVSLTAVDNADDGSFIRTPLKRAARSETWFQMPALPKLAVTRIRTSCVASTPEPMEDVLSLEKIRNQFSFQVVGSSNLIEKYAEFWSWYCAYLEHRAVSAWSVCAAALANVSVSTATDSVEARCALYASFTVIVECMHADGDVGLGTIIGRLHSKKLLQSQVAEQDVVAFVFQAIGWLSALWDPLPEPDLPILSLRCPEIAGRRKRRSIHMRKELTVEQACSQKVRRISSRLGAPIPVPVCGTDSESAINRDIECASITASYLSFHSLTSLVQMKVVWTDSMLDHLKFDSRSKSLFIFRHPSRCLFMMKAEGDTMLSKIFESERKEKQESEQQTCSAMLDFEDLLLELLQSYRIIFGSHKASRKAITGKHLQASAVFGEQKGGIDPLLLLLCTAPPESPQLKALYNDLQLTNFENEIPLSDVPFLGKRMCYLESVSKSHAPNSLSRLWRDRRSPTTWFALWAFLIVGLGTLVLQLFQLAFQIYQPPIGH